MKTALDNYSLGKQKEVFASDFENTMRYQSGRFQCPVCGEDVILVIPKERAKYFKHYKRTDTSMECDRRINTYEQLNIYDRIGLSVYLKNRNNEYFFAIQFRAITNIDIDFCMKKNGYIEIVDDIFQHSYAKFKINRINFIPNEVSYLRIDRFPSYKNRLVIRYSDKSIQKELTQKWPEYINYPIPKYGAFFSYEKNKGKIIRAGDSIATYTKYYWVNKLSNYEISQYSCSSIKQVGNIKYNGDLYHVFVVEFNVSVNDISAFRKLSHYLESDYKLRLLDKDATIRPIWPPCIKTSVGYNSFQSNKIINRIVSPNDEPMVFMFPYPFIRSCNYHITEYGRNDIQTIQTTSYGTLINIDKKLSSQGILYENKNINFPDFKPMLIDNESNELHGSYVRDDLEDLSFESQKGLNVIKIDKDNIVYILKTLDKNITISNIKKGDQYFFLNHLYNVADIKIQITEDEIEESKTDEEKLLNLMNKYCVSNEVIIPITIRKKLLNLLAKSTNKKIEKIINSYLNKNSIPVVIMNYLKRG